MQFSNLDFIVFIGYIIFVVAVGLYLSLSKKNESAQDYFLASKTLGWWAIGGSLIASNISAEQFIGMSGSGYSVGLAIASYELMAAATLLLVAKYFLPVFLKEGIYTMPQFLEERFDKRVRTGLAFFWVFLIVFVNITSVLYLGGLALRPLMGIDANGNFILPLFYAILGLALYSATFSIFGGLKAVVWTDVIQVVVLVFGGLLTTIIALNVVSDGQGFFAGLNTLYEKAPEKFDMILDRSNPEYKNLPGISVLIGGMWIANIYYWGTNQYIIQRALAAKNIQEAQKGVAMASVLKVILPIIVVVPGIAAYVLQAEINKPDEAYPWLLNTYVTAGFKGLTFAALISAVGSSLSSMVNSASTIFTLDIYKPFIGKEASDITLVRVGKVASALALLVGVMVAPSLGALDQAFQYIQEYTGFISPGIVAIFLFGLFWKKTSTNAALVVVILAIPLSTFLKFATPWIPFLDRMGLGFLILSVLIVAISLWENKGNDPKAIRFSPGLFRTNAFFNISALIVVIALVIIYGLFW